MKIVSAPPRLILCAHTWSMVGYPTPRREWSIERKLSAIQAAGFDGVAPAAWASYRLCTVRQPVRRMTEAAVAMLMERIDDPELPPEVRTFAGALVEGDSARLKA